MLTINETLQEICERALVKASDSLRADGGDIVVMNPFTGEILAMASRRANAGTVANTAVAEPFEPGSTLKPFIAAALLQRRRAHPDEVIETFNGQAILEGRLVTDDHKAPQLSLSDVIRYSSNVGIVRFAERLTGTLSIAFGLGFSYAFDRPEVEQRLENDTQQFLLFWQLELTAGPRDGPWSAVLRLHHRSPGWGVMGVADGGMNAPSFGFRYAF